MLLSQGIQKIKYTESTKKGNAKGIVPCNYTMLLIFYIDEIH